jgi:hypothetical protein
MLTVAGSAASGEATATQAGRRRDPFDNDQHLLRYQSEPEATASRTLSQTQPHRSESCLGRQLKITIVCVTNRDRWQTRFVEIEALSLDPWIGWVSGRWWTAWE